MKLNIKLIDRIVGLFVLVAILGIIALMIFIGLNQKWFKKNYTFTSKFNSASNLTPGMPITLSGFEIGKVDRIDLDPKNKIVNIEFSIYDEYYHTVVFPNSIIELVASPIGLGSGMIFHPGKLQGDNITPIPPGSYIPAYNTDDGLGLVTKGLVDRAGSDDSIGSIIAQISPIIQQVPPILFAVKSILSEADEAIKGTKKSQLGTMVYNLNDLLTEVDNSLKQVNSALAGTSQGPIGKILYNANAIIEGKDKGPLGNTLNNISTLSDSLNAMLTDEKKKLDSMLVNVQGMMTNLEKTTANIEKLTADPTGLAIRVIDPKGSIKTFLDDKNVLFDQVAGMLSDVKSIISEFEKFAQFITGTAPQIAGILEQGKDTLSQGKDVLEGLKNNPLLSGGITKEKEQATTFTSGRDEGF